MVQQRKLKPKRRLSPCQQYLIVGFIKVRRVTTNFVRNENERQAQVNKYLLAKSFILTCYNKLYMANSFI